MEQNTQTERVQLTPSDLGLTEPVVPTTPVETPKEVEAPQVEKEYVYVDGERIEIDPNEVIGEKPDGTPMYLRETDNPKSYKFYQAKDTKKDLRIKQLEEKLGQFEKKIQQPEPVKQETPVIQMPAEVVELPDNFDFIEAQTNPESNEAKLYAKYLKNQSEWTKYNRIVAQEIQKERAMTAQEKQIAQQKAWAIGEVQKYESDPIKAQQIFDWFTNEVLAKDNFKEIVNFYNVSKSKPATQQKIDQFDKNGKRQTEYILPPGVIPTQPAPTEFNFGEALTNTVKQTRI